MFFCFISKLAGILGSSSFTVVTHKIQNRDACQLIIDSKVVWSCNITALQTGNISRCIYWQFDHVYSERFMVEKKTKHIVYTLTISLQNVESFLNQRPVYIRIKLRLYNLQKV